MMHIIIICVDGKKLNFKNYSYIAYKYNHIKSMSQTMFHKKTVEEKRRDREERAKKELENKKQKELEPEENTQKQSKSEPDIVNKVKKNNAVKPVKEIPQNFNRFSALVGKR
jgi:hypothetical protein